MSAPWILLCIVIVLVLIGQIRVGCKAEYDQDGVQVFIRISAFYIRVFPLKKKDKEKRKGRPHSRARATPLGTVVFHNNASVILVRPQYILWV